jgi:chlorite dismutase
VPFKQLIYEMRFDEVSAVYALFGEFCIGLRVPSEKFGSFMKGEIRNAVE